MKQIRCLSAALQADDLTTTTSSSSGQRTTVTRATVVPLDLYREKLYKGRGHVDKPPERDLNTNTMTDDFTWSEKWRRCRGPIRSEGKWTTTWLKIMWYDLKLQLANKWTEMNVGFRGFVSLNFRSTVKYWFLTFLGQWKHLFIRNNHLTSRQTSGDSKEISHF